MKKVIALLAAVIVLAGSVEMMAAAATKACEHSSHRREEVTDTIETYTHYIKVGTSTSGNPIFSLCLVEIKWHHYNRVCNMCGKIIVSDKEKVYELHSMH
ncbi:MAG: hypothetical protein HDR08_13205 [Lachnospiraceae bacterium]|nr:hypothetical protein [Lachnospiraceae bacterium]